MAISRRAGASAGYAYLALLFAVVLIGAGLGGAVQVWHTTMQRERERQLLWVGGQYRRAIRLYWQGVGGGNGANAGVLQGNNANAQNTIVNQVPTTPQTGGAGAVSPAGGPNGTVPGGSTGVLPGGAAGVPAGPTRYPPNLEALLVDPRSQQIKRYIRKLYPDPITGKNDWVPILAPNGGVMGVRSLSDDAPLKQAHFPPEDNAFQNKEHYSQWEFVYIPPQRTNAPQAQPSPVPNYGPAPGVNPGANNGNR